MERKSPARAAPWPLQSNSSSVSLFPAGSNFQIYGGSFVQNNDFTATQVLKPLYNMVSPNAILNAGGRADSVSCYPGTREEVIARIEKWRRANHRQGHPIFWLSGPAGAGKSAIIQTIAERCIKDKVPMANFFFFRADATRNHSESVVATLLFQLFKLFPALKAHVADIISENPIILRQSMQDQFLTLIEEPLRAIWPISGQGPPIVFIDGLDECSSEHGKTEQTSLLRILDNISTKVDPAFIVLVASRNEAHLTMTLNEIGTSPDSIYLDASYRPLDDIRLFLSREFSRIRETHSLRNTLDTNWPLPADIDSISQKSSGQFVFPATVIRFIATSPGSPRRSLEIVLGLRPVTKIQPFATLDSLYTYILSQVEDWESVQDILAANQVLSVSEATGHRFTYYPPNLLFCLAPLGYTEDDVVSNISELAAIVRFTKGHLTVYHASLADFLRDKSRAGKFYMDMAAFTCRLVMRHLKQATVSRLRKLDDSFPFIPLVRGPNEILDELLDLFLPKLDALRYYYNNYINRLFAERNLWTNTLPTADGLPPRNVNSQLQKLLKELSECSYPPLPGSAMPIPDPNMGTGMGPAVPGTPNQPTLINVPVQMADAQQVGKSPEAPKNPMPILTWDGMLKFNGKFNGATQELCAYVTVATMTPALARSEIWPTDMHIVPTPESDITLPDIKEWAILSKAARIVFSARRLNVPEHSAYAFNSLIQLLTTRKLFATAAWNTGPNRGQTSNMFIFPVNGTNLAGVCFPMAGIPNLPGNIPYPYPPKNTDAAGAGQLIHHALVNMTKEQKEMLENLAPEQRASVIKSYVKKLGIDRLKLAQMQQQRQQQQEQQQVQKMATSSSPSGPGGSVTSPNTRPSPFGAWGMGMPAGMFRMGNLSVDSGADGGMMAPPGGIGGDAAGGMSAHMFQPFMPQNEGGSEHGGA